MLNAGAGGRALQMGVVTSGGHVAGSLWRSCGSVPRCWWLFRTEREQLLHGAALVVQ